MTKHLEETTIDISSSGLRAYYVHPESRSHYASFPVESMTSEVVLPIISTRNSYFKIEDRIKSGFLGRYSATLPEEASRLFADYGLDDYIPEYFIGVLRETDTEALSILLVGRELWDQPETATIDKWRGSENPSAPFEYFWESSE